MPVAKPLSVVLRRRPVHSFCSTVGWNGVGLYALALGVAAGHFYIAAEYTFYYRIMHVDGVWFFFLCAILFVVMVLYHLVVWKKVANAVTARRPGSFVRRGMCQRMEAFRATFGINGKRFLLKLYISEILKTGMQVYNLLTLYTCALPPALLFVLCLLLCVEHLHRLYFVWKPLTASRRDTKVFVNMCVDLLCATLPLSFMWLWFRVPVPINEMLAVVALPTMFILIRLNELMAENVHRRASEKIVQWQSAKSIKSGRRRSTMYEKTIVETAVRQQGMTINRHIRCAVTVGTVMTGLFFLGMAVLSMAVISLTDCNQFLWDACMVKVPLCRFSFSCNCAVLLIKRHNRTSLPPAIESMTAMRKLQINNGPLKTLPELGSFMPVLAHVNLDFNKLRALPASFGEAKHLVMLYAAFNEIAFVPGAILQHDAMTNLDLSTNRITRLPKIRLTQLLSFIVANNSISTLPESLFDHAYIERLVVDGNRLKSLPSNVGNSGKTLTFFAASRNNLTSLPFSFQRLGKLKVLDLRNNSLAYLPEWFDELTSLNHLTVGGNPLCSNGWGGSGNVQKLMTKKGEGCEKQCSDMCLDLTLYESGDCGYDCTAQECDFEDKRCAN